MASVYVQKYKLIILFLNIYFSVNSFVLAVKYSVWSNQIMIAVVLLTAIVSVIKGNNPVSQNGIVLLILAFLNIMCTAFIYGYTGGYMLFCLNFILIVSILHLYTKEEFIESFVKIMCFLSIFALISGILSIVAPSVLGLFGQYRNSVFDVYADMFFAFQNTSVIRINSIWGEAGMYAVFLIFALFFETFNCNKEPSFRRILILSGALLLTFSTTGLVCYLLYVVALAFNRGRFQGRLLWGMGGIALLALVLINNVEVIQMQFVTAGSKLSSDDISFIGRFAPIIYNIQEGLKNPIFGQGMTSGKFYVDYSFYQGFLACDTSTTTALFKNFGLLLPSITVFLSFRLARNETQTAMATIVSFVLLLVNVNTQNLIYDQIYWSILFVPFMCSARYMDEIE